MITISVKLPKCNSIASLSPPIHLESYPFSYVYMWFYKLDFELNENLLVVLIISLPLSWKLVLEIKKKNSTLEK